MATRAELLTEVERLESRMTALTADRNAFFRSFEDEADRLAALAGAGEYAWLMDELLRMVQRHGITPTELKR